MKKDKLLVMENKFWPQYRDADQDGFIGVRGFMNYFQDITSHHLFLLEYGNKHILPKYNKIWLITKYKLTLIKKVEFTNENLTVKTWIEKSSSNVVVNQIMCVYKKDELYAYGKLELCTVDFKSQRLSKLSDIDFPKEFMIDSPSEVNVKFDRINEKNLEETLSHTHMVRFTDLDNSNHMNNLSYVSMFLDAFSVSQYNKLNIKNFSINYLNQSYFGEKIDVFTYKNENMIIMLGKKRDGVIVSKCMFEIE